MRRRAGEALAILLFSGASCKDVPPNDETEQADKEAWRAYCRCESHVVIEVTNDGHHIVEEKEHTARELRALLHARAEAAPRDADDLPLVSVEMRARAECEYKHIQVAMVQCMREGIWRLWFGLVGEDGLCPPRRDRLKALKEGVKSLRDAGR